MNLKTERKRRGLTQSAAASIIGAPLPTWRAWEQGRRNMPAAKLTLWLMLAGEPKQGAQTLPAEPRCIA